MLDKAAFKKATAGMSFKAPKSTPHLIIKAGAGTGKTFTLVGGVQQIKGMTPQHKPSPQQAAVWDQIEKSKSARSIAIIAFAKAIATTLQKRVPAGVEAMTTHSMSNKAVRNAFGKVNLNKFRVDNIISDITGIDSYDLKQKKMELLQGAKALVKHCKMSLLEPTQENLEMLTVHYDIELNGSRSEVFALVPQILERCQQNDGEIDFDDMIWLPIVLDLPMFKYDLLLVDESQDLNRCQQAIARKCGRRLVLCGDEKQAIFGFAGADCDSMNRMERELSETEDGCLVLPLNETRRCAKSIVAEANKIFPDFYAHESNPLGEVSYASYKGDGKDSYFTQAKAGDACLCRVNAPLVMQCFRFLKEGRKAEILGRDVGAGLISLIKKTKAESIPDLIQALDEWSHKEMEKENRKRNPSESRLIAIQDKHDCIVIFTEGADTIAEVIDRVEEMFSDGKVCPKCQAKGNVDQDTCYKCKVALVPTTGVKFSTIHKSKGLEFDRVFILEPKGASVPHPMAKSGWQMSQEWCLRFVAITRAISHLTYVQEQD